MDYSSYVWLFIFGKSVVLDHLGSDDIDGGDGKIASDKGILSLTGHLASADMVESRSPEKLYCDIMQPLQFGNIL